MSKKANCKLVMISKRPNTIFIENIEGLLQRYTNFHVKTNKGYYQYHSPSGLYICSSCSELLDQEYRIQYDSLCPGCRWTVNAGKMLNYAQKQGIIS